MGKFKDLMKQIPKATAESFSITIITFAILDLILGVKVIEIIKLIEILVGCAIVSIIHRIAFTNIILKKLAYIKRLVLFMFTLFVVLAGFIVISDLFPINSLKGWSIFIGTFIINFIVSIISFEIYFRSTGEKYTGLLNEYKNKKK